MKSQSESDKPLDVLVEEKTPPQRTLYKQHLDAAATAAFQGRQQRRDDAADAWLADPANAAAMAAVTVKRIAAVEPRKQPPFKRRGHIRGGVAVTPLPVPCEAATSRTDTERQAMILEHEPLARKIATRARGHAIPLGATDDHLQSAHLGLIEAEPRFDPDESRWGKFGSYSRWHALEQVAAQNRLNQSVVDGSGFDVRLDTPIATDDAELAATLADSMIVGPDGKGSFPGPRSGAVPEPEAPPFTPEQHAALVAALDALPDRERRIVEARWLADEPLTRVALGDELGISAQRVAVLEERAMKRLKAAMGVQESADVFRLQERSAMEQKAAGESTMAA